MHQFADLCGVGIDRDSAREKTDGAPDVASFAFECDLTKSISELSVKSPGRAGSESRNSRRRPADGYFSFLSVPR